jgi:hypothetical protein
MVITTVLVLTQIIRLMQNAISLRKMQQFNEKDVDVQEMWEELTYALHRFSDTVEKWYGEDDELENEIDCNGGDLCGCEDCDDEGEEVKCPVCSSNVIDVTTMEDKSRNVETWLCEECGHVFSEESDG